MTNDFALSALSAAQQATDVVAIAMIVATAAYSGRPADAMALEGVLTQLRRSSLDVPLMAAPSAPRQAIPMHAVAPLQGISAILNASLVQQAVATNRSMHQSQLSSHGGHPSNTVNPSLAPVQPKGVQNSVTAPHIKPHKA